MARVVDGLTLADGDAGTSKAMGARIARLSPRWFVMRNAHDPEGPTLLQPRWAMSWLRGPLTRSELRQALDARKDRRRFGEVARGGVSL